MSTHFSYRYLERLPLLVVVAGQTIERGLAAPCATKLFDPVSGDHQMNSHSLFDPLTPREHAVLELIVKGATSREASETLAISPRTIEFHRANIMQKFSARNVADLIRIVLTS